MAQEEAREGEDGGPGDDALDAGPRNDALDAGPAGDAPRSPREREDPDVIPLSGVRGTDRADGREEGSRPGLLRRAWRFFTRQRGNRLWDTVLRGTGILAVLGVLLVLLFPRSGPLVGFSIFTIWITGPLSPFFPVGYEPVLMLFGRLYPPLLIACVSVAVQLYIEFVNYHIHRKLLELDAAESFRESKIVRRLQGLFDRAPFFTVWFCAWSPIPYWSMRILGPLSGYPVPRYLTATFLGRLPKMWLFAALGTFWAVSDRLLIGAVVVSLLLGLVLWAYRRGRPKDEQAGEGPVGPDPAVLAQKEPPVEAAEGSGGA